MRSLVTRGCFRETKPELGAQTLSLLLTPQSHAVALSDSLMALSSSSDLGWVQPNTRSATVPLSSATHPSPPTTARPLALRTSPRLLARYRSNTLASSNSSSARLTASPTSPTQSLSHSLSQTQSPDSSFGLSPPRPDGGERVVGRPSADYGTRRRMSREETAPYTLASLDWGSKEEDSRLADLFSSSLGLDAHRGAASSTVAGNDSSPGLEPRPDDEMQTGFDEEAEDAGDEMDHECNWTPSGQGHPPATGSPSRLRPRHHQPQQQQHMPPPSTVAMSYSPHSGGVSPIPDHHTHAGRNEDDAMNEVQLAAEKIVETNSLAGQDKARANWIQTW